MLVQNPLKASGEYEDYFVFQENNKKGVRNSKDKVIIPAMYDDLGWSIGEFNPVEDVVGFKENGKWGLITLKNKQITAAEFQNLYPLNRELIAASKLQNEIEQYALIDVEGVPKTAYQYGKVNMFNNLIVASKLAGNQMRYGLLNLSLQEIVPFNYSMIKTLNNQFALITNGDLSGVIDASGEIVVEPKFHEIMIQGNLCKGKLFNTYEIRNAQNQLLSTHQASSLRRATAGILIRSNRSESQLLNLNGEVIASFKDAEILDFEGDLAVIKHNGLYGVINASGKVLTPPTSQSAWIHDGFIGIQSGEEVWNLFDSNMKQITTRKYQSIQPANQGLFQFQRLGNWGFMNVTGEEIIPPQYQQTSSFDQGAAFAKYLGSWGVIDTNGHWLVMPRYDKLEKLNSDTFIFQLGNDYGLVKAHKQEVYRTSNELIPALTGAIEKNNNGQYGLISTNGESLLSLQYKSIRPFEENPNYHLFENQDGYGIYNIAASTFFQDTAIQEMRTLNEGYIGIKLNNQYGLIDLNGKLRIANRYEDVGVFNEDMLPIKIRGRWGYVDRIERLVVQPVYQSADHFLNGLAIVSQNGKSGLIDKHGKLVVKLDYDQLQRLPGGLIVSHRGNKAGLISAEGRVLIFPGYAEVEVLDNGYIKVSRNGKQGLIDRKGMVLIPTSYDKLTYDHHNDVYHLTKENPVTEIRL